MKHFNLFIAATTILCLLTLNVSAIDGEGYFEYDDEEYVEDEITYDIEDDTVYTNVDSADEVIVDDEGVTIVEDGETYDQEATATEHNAALQNTIDLTGGGEGSEAEATTTITTSPSTGNSTNACTLIAVAGAMLGVAIKKRR